MSATIIFVGHMPLTDPRSRRSILDDLSTVAGPDGHASDRDLFGAEVGSDPERPSLLNRYSRITAGVVAR